MRILDWTSWQGLLTTLLGLALITLIGVGIWLILMQTVQRRRERENRQINERLRTLIAAYKTFGGSFTGDLAVDPTHLQDLDEAERSGWDRSRRIRDAVEAALSDIILLGTEEHVRLAVRAATELAEGRSVHTAELVVSLRNFIRNALDLDPVPTDIVVPNQGPARAPASRGRSKAGGGERDSSRQGAAKAGESGGMATSVGLGLGLGSVVASSDEDDGHRR